MLLLTNSFVLAFDCHLLRYKEGSEVAEHRDPVTGKKHYRLNIILKNASKGGEFNCANAIYSGSRVKLFRPDVCAHSVTLVESGTRYVFSLGWVRQ